MDDVELLRAWSRGDENAGNELVERHFSGVFGFFNNKVDDVDDLTQRTFLGCLEGLAQFRGESSFRAYLFGIARKQLLRHFDEQRRRGGKLDVDAMSIEELAPSPSGIMAARQEEQLLAAALRRIPIDMQITVELYYCDELSVGEVAAVLDVAPGTIKSRLARARELLRDAIATSGAAERLQTSTVENLEEWAKRLRSQGSAR
jgi:RNA polymerase sigma factor (sigma-70 family)